MAPYFKERCLAVNCVEVLVLPERKVSVSLKRQVYRTVALLSEPQQGSCSPHVWQHLKNMLISTRSRNKNAPFCGRFVIRTFGSFSIPIIAEPLYRTGFDDHRCSLRTLERWVGRCIEENMQVCWRGHHRMHFVDMLKIQRMQKQSEDGSPLEAFKNVSNAISDLS